MLGIAPDDTLDDLTAFVDQMGLTFPVLWDEDRSVRELYEIQNEFSAYPEDWVIGADGTVLYVNNRYEQDAILGIVEGQLQ